VKCLRENRVVPTGLWILFPLYPTLKALGYPVPPLRRCIPAGNGLRCSTNCLEIGFSRGHWRPALPNGSSQRVFSAACEGVRHL